MNNKIIKKVILVILLLVVIGVVVLVIYNSSKVSSIPREENSIIEQKSEDGVLVIGEKMYITQINDIYLNPQNYFGRTVEIEGFPLTDPDTGYTFVGRYGPGCCVSDTYACMEYQYAEGTEKINLVDEEDWIKVKGTIKKGFDGMTTYTYIEATSIEKLAERGKDTLTN